MAVMPWLRNPRLALHHNHQRHHRHHHHRHHHLSQLSSSWFISSRVSSYSLLFRPPFGGITWNPRKKTMKKITRFRLAWAKRGIWRSAKRASRRRRSYRIVTRWTNWARMMSIRRWIVGGWYSLLLIVQWNDRGWCR